MKMRALLLSLLASATAPLLQAQFLYEGFNYNAGTNLIGNGAWAEDNTGIDPTIAAGNLNTAGLQPSTGNRVQLPGFVGDTRGAQVGFTSSGTVTDVYYSFLMRFDSVNSLSTTFTSLSRVEVGGTNGIGLAVRQNGGSTDLFDLGIHKRANTASSETGAAIQGLSESTTYFVVMRYLTNGGADQMDLWLNPSSATFGNNGLIPAASFTSTLGTDTAVDWDTFALTPPAQTTGYFDELRIGADWASVTPVPEPSALTLAGLAVALFALRRRRPDR